MGWLAKNNIDEVDVMGHSFGSVYVNYILGLFKIRNPNNFLKIDKKIYLEPVAFYCLTTVVNQTAYGGYKWHANKSIITNLKKILFYYFIQRDIYNIMKKYINLPDIFEYNIKMDNKTLILLSGKDYITKSNYLKDYVEKYWPDVKLIYNEDETHGSIISSRNKYSINKKIYDFIDDNNEVLI